MFVLQLRKITQEFMDLSVIFLLGVDRQARTQFQTKASLLCYVHFQLETEKSS